MTWLVENAVPNQAREVAEILHGWNTETTWLPKLYSLDETVEFAQMMIGKGWVSVVQNGQVTGFLARDGAVVHALYVAADASGRGIGTALLRDAQQQQHELELWTFQNNTMAQGFYQAHGFEEAERTDGAGNDEKLPDIRYVWRAKEAAYDTA